MRTLSIRVICLTGLLYCCSASIEVLAQEDSDIEAALANDTAICKSLIAGGVRNYTEFLSDKQIFQETKSRFCAADFQSLQDVRDRGGKVGISLPLAESILGLNASNRSSQTVFQERKSEFCKSSYGSYRYSDFVQSKKATISESMVNGFNECIRTILSANTKAVITSAVLQPDYIHFTLTVNYSPGTGTEKIIVENVIPRPLVSCEYYKDGAVQNLPITVGQQEFHLECMKKSGTGPVSVSLQTSNYPSPAAVALPGKETEQLVLKDVRNQIRLLEEKLATINSVYAGSVVAFDSNTCPDGWQEFTRARGRTIVGTNPRARQGLSRRILRATGGRENVKITEATMPGHRHKIDTDRGVMTEGSTSVVRHVDWDTTNDAKGNTSSTGGGQAHENMPPWVALRYCVKD